VASGSARVGTLVACAGLIVACSAPARVAPTPPLPEQTTSAALPGPVGTGPAKLPRRLLWRGSTGANPEIHGGVIVGGLPGEVQEVDARTGQLRWRVSYGPSEPLLESFVVGADTVILAVSRDRSRPLTAAVTLPEALLAVDLATGRRLCSRRVSRLASQTAAATIVGTTLVLASLTGELIALDARTGSPRWTATQGPRSSACPSQSFGDVQLASPGAMLLVARQCPHQGAVIQRLDPKNGRMRWTFALDTHHVDGTPAPSVSVQAQGDATVFGVADTFNPRRDFGVTVLRALLPIAPDSGNVGGRFLLSLDARSGRVRWAVPSPSEYVTTGAGTVCSFDDQTYQCRDGLSGRLTVRPPSPPLSGRISAYGEAPLAQVGPLVFVVGAGRKPGLVALDRRTEVALGQLPLSVSGASAPETAYGTSVVAAGSGLVLVRRGDQRPFDVLAYTDAATS